VKLVCLIVGAFVLSVLVACATATTNAQAAEGNRVKVGCLPHTVARLDFLRDTNHRHAFSGGGEGILREDVTVEELQNSQSSCAFADDTAVYWTMLVKDAADSNVPEKILTMKIYYDLNRMDLLPKIGDKFLGTYEGGDVTFRCGDHGHVIQKPPVGCTAEHWRATINFPDTNISMAVHYENSGGKLRSMPLVSGDEGWEDWRHWHADGWFTPKPQFLKRLDSCKARFDQGLPLGKECRTTNKDIDH
jgi:hypothetical protein